jgi:hypothetical protein
MQKGHIGSVFISLPTSILPQNYLADFIKYSYDIFNAFISGYLTDFNVT